MGRCKEVSLREKKMVTAAFNLGVDVGEESERKRYQAETAELAEMAVSGEETPQMLRSNRDKSTTQKV